MKKSMILLCVFALLLSCAAPAYAAGGKVTYSGQSGKFIFAPGSKYSPTDLFPNFKDVMPGDKLSQPITVKNDASNKVKVVIYMRSLGAHEDSVEFLSKLRLRVEKSAENTMGYMFDAAASETAQLTEWVCLGTLYSGGEVNLNVILDVPTDLNNDFQQLIGYLDWEFKIEELPIEPTDPEPPKTGDDAPIFLWAGMMIVSFSFLLLLILMKKRKEREEN
jgi:LPXTG-motif cell wall-anchored protein